eukprot:TRINITY_DN2063_c0_g1_i1.p1 TRINITY_DN2063_c0_g1~~TRINITY_DN2063_c0_g1_i1.p1  ORF type:complete len:322 (-),score=32.24 TRINITY_DN2063_c0_g1_i1:581-1546(-)
MAAGSCQGLFLLAVTCTLYLATVVCGDVFEQPVYVWSDHRCLSPEDRTSQDLADTHSDFAMQFLQSYIGTESKCLDRHIPAAETAVVFIGNELRLSDESLVSSTEGFNLQVLLKTSGVTAGYSVELRAVGSSTERSSVAATLVATAASSPSDNLGKIAAVGACGIKSKDIASFGLEDLTEYLEARKEARRSGSTDLLIVCMSPDDGFTRHELMQYEGKVLSETLSVLQTTGTSYVALYTSDWTGESYGRSRSLIESEPDTNGTSNTTGNSTGPVCNELCRKRATLWESLFVFLILLIILISGTCCMTGVNTPTRFETSKES